MACFMAVRMLRRKLMIIILTLFAFIEIYLLLIDDTKRGTDSSLSSFLSNDLNKASNNVRSYSGLKRTTADYGSKTTPKVCKPVNSRLFPLCKEKFQALKYFWKTTCFKDVHKLDGTDCSILRYLQEIEPYCSKQNSKSLDDEESKKTFQRKQEFRDDLGGLLSLLKHRDFYKMRERMIGLWPEWMDARKTLKLQKKFRLGNSKKILVFLGAFSYQKWLLTGESGIMGELVQWADLITSLYILGHDIQVVLDEKKFPKMLQKDENGCASAKLNESQIYDLIFTDISGYNIMQFKTVGPSNLARLKCKVRILDSFGTEAEFNYDGYKDKIPGGKSPWGNLNLHLQQFMTYFPHSPDNTFLGFAAGSSKSNKNKPIQKKDWAVIYGKHSNYLSGNSQYLEIIKDYFELHATMIGKTEDYPYIKNHGVLHVKNLTNLLAQAKLFIGLGFPFEGPGPLDAISQGAVYLNPKFAVPKNKLNDDFFKGKPILRKVTSQNSYLEDFVRQPHSYTVDVRDKEELVAILKKIKNQKSFPPYLPKEFTNLGLLEKIHVFLQNQTFCDEDMPRWPPVENLHLFLAHSGISCKDECLSRGMICEATYFSDINAAKSLEKFGIDCSKVISVKKLHSPSFNVTSGTCYIQDHHFYYSCVAEYSDIRRLCPCRTYIPGQTSICENCL